MILILAIGVVLALWLTPTGVKGLSMFGLLARVSIVSVLSVHALMFVGQTVDKVYVHLVEMTNH